MIASNPDLSVCALASGSQSLDRLAAELDVEHAQVGGDVVELLEASEPDLVLNAVVGFAGVGATLWALERGVTLALANKESLVAAGDLAMTAWRRGGGLLLPVDSEHSALHQCLDGHSPQTVESIVLTASGGPFRNRSARRARISDRGGSPRASHVVHGPEDHDRLRHAREQGPGAHRGALPLRHRVRADRGRRASDLGRPRARPLPRRRGARASRAIRTCASRSRSRSRIPSAARPRCRVSISPPDSRSSSSRPTRSGSRCSRWPARRESEAARTRAPSTRRTRSRWRRSSTAASGSPRSRRSSRTRSGPSTALPRAISASSSRPTSRRGASRREDWRSGMSIFIAILGLAFLILVHEAGHFFASLAVGLRPRRFYVGFPPAVAKTTRNGIEYGIGAIPLGGFVTIPGMHRRSRTTPSVGSRALWRRRRRSPAPSTASSARSTATTWQAGLYALDDLEDALRRTRRSRRLRSHPPRRGSPSCATRSGRTRTGRRRRGGAWSRSRPGRRRTSLLTIVIFTFLFMTVAGEATRTVATIAPELEAGVGIACAGDGAAGRRPDRRDQRARVSQAGRDRRHDQRVRREES